MNERAMQYRVGVMVVATLLIVGILVALFGGLPELFQPRYRVKIHFDTAPGVTKDTPIRKNGIRIGTVTYVDFDEHDRGVVVTAEIDKSRALYQDEACRVVSSLLMGDAVLEFYRVPGRQPTQKVIPDGARIDGESPTASDPAQAIVNLQSQLAQTLTSVNRVSADMQTVLQRFDGLLAKNEERITQIIKQTDTTLGLLQTSLKGANDVLGDDKLRVQLKEAVAQMPEVLKDTRRTLDGMGKSVNSLHTNLQNIEGLTKPLGDRGEILVQRIDDSTTKLNKLMDQMLVFTDQMNNPDGSLGRLMHDRELYDHINRAARNIDELSRDLKPIMSDIRVFSDKIARHPESLGVRGALQKNSGLK